MPQHSPKASSLAEIVSIISLFGIVILGFSWKNGLITTALLFQILVGSSAAIVLALMVFSFKRGQIPKNGRPSFVYWLKVFPALCGITVYLAAGLEGFFLLAYVAAQRFLMWMQNPLTERGPAILVSIPLALLIGGLLFSLRLKFRAVYGFLEIITACLVAVSQIASVTPISPFNGIAFLTAAVYLVVRGLDNIHQGWIAKPPDRLAKWIVTKLNKGYPLI